MIRMIPMIRSFRWRTPLSHLYFWCFDDGDDYIDRYVNEDEEEDEEDDDAHEDDEDDEDDDENDIQLFPNWPSSDDFEATTISLPAQELFYWRSESEDLRPMPGARIQKQKQSPFPATRYVVNNPAPKSQ